MKPTTTPPLKPDALVVYKGHPARVCRIADKVEIEGPDGTPVRVRPKDVVVLHPGPFRSFDELEPPPHGEIETAREMLVGTRFTLAELAELAFGSWTPATAWAAWQRITEGIHFVGTPGSLTARSAEEVKRVLEIRAARAAERAAWGAFLERVESGRITPEDAGYLEDVEALALGRGTESRLLRELGRSQSREEAHDLLLRLGWWDETKNPHPVRAGVDLEPPDFEIRPFPDEHRLDLTHLPALAIDDEGNLDPDDAIGAEGDRLWVHVADVAALVPPDDPVDADARARGATLYLPEKTVPMLPPAFAARLGLGLREVTEALSIGIDLDAAGEIRDLVIAPSRVRAVRMTYEEAEERLSEEPLASVDRITRRFAQRRAERGAARIEMPEVRVRVRNGDVTVTPYPPLRSRRLVREAMLMAGEAVARFAVEHEIPFPFTTQPAPSGTGEPARTMAQMYALRRSLPRSRRQVSPEEHGGLGLALYAQATSPLRRYPDLVAHQQIRAFLGGESILPEEKLIERVGAAEAAAALVRQAERLSKRHWTLVYLMRNPEWRGRAVLVDRMESRGSFLVPDLGLEIRMHLEEELPLDSEVLLKVLKVDLPRLDVIFRIIETRPPRGV